MKNLLLIFTFLLPVRFWSKTYAQNQARSLIDSLLAELPLLKESTSAFENFSTFIALKDSTVGVHKSEEALQLKSKKSASGIRSETVYQKNNV